MPDNVFLLPVIDCIKTSWKKLYGAKATLWAALGIFFFLMFCFWGAITGSAIFLASAPVMIVLVVIFEILILLTVSGILYIGIQRAYDRPISYKMVFYAYDIEMTVKIIGLILLQMLIMLIPLFFLVGAPLLLTGIPVTDPSVFNLTKLLLALIYLISFVALFYLGMRMVLSIGFVLDLRMGPLNAIFESFARTRHNFWRLVGYYLLKSIIYCLGFVALGIGLIWTIPFIFVCYGVLYKTLTHDGSD